MVNRIHVIDPDVRRRARVARELNTYSLHAEIYDSVDEFLDVAPVEGLVLAFDDSDRRGQQVSGIIRTSGVDLPVVGYAEDPSTQQVVQSMLAGASGYLQWPFNDCDFVSMLNTMAEEGESRLRRERVLSEARSQVGTLSPRERQVLTGLITGWSNKQIAQTLGISPRTVEIHRSNMMMKLRAKSVADAVRIGLYAGIADDLDVSRLNEAARLQDSGGSGAFDTLMSVGRCCPVLM